MSNNDFQLSRRKALAALGTVGVASAGAGLGTSAYFSDQETFENNRLVAGTLDLKVDWEEHYSDWSDAEADAVTDVVMTEGDPTAVPTGYVGLPDPESPLIAIPSSDRDLFMDATSIEAYPDTNNDGIQDPIPSDTTACEYLADVGNDDDGLDPSGPRTDNDDTNVEGEAAPLVNLNDLKPGDFGELTLSFHLCDNPGYVWLNGSIDYNAENDVTEPEADDPDENNDAGDFDDMMDGELAQAIQTRVWLDDCDNVVEDGEAYLTPQMSLVNLMAMLNMNNGVPVCADNGLGGGEGGDDDDNGTGEEESTCPVVEGDDAYTLHQSGDVVFADPLPFPPNSPDPDPQDITIEDNPRCTEIGLIEALRTDEDAADQTDGPGPLPVVGTTEYTTEFGTFTITTEQISDDRNRITSWTFDPVGDYCVAKVIVKGGNEGANVYSYDTAGDEDDFTDDEGGVTGHTDANLTTPTQQGISHADFCLRTVEPTGDPGGGDNGDTGETEQDECCFEPSTTNCVGFAWWLPVDHANELQSDGVGFDLGFYTEQCRHNDGSGMNNSNVDPDEYDA